MATALRIDKAQGGGVDDGRVRAELCARFAQLGRDQALLSVGELCRRTDALRTIARLNGFTAVARLASGLGDSLASHGRAATVRTYLDLMVDALDCPQFDSAAGDAFLAAASVRLA